MLLLLRYQHIIIVLVLSWAIITPVIILAYSVREKKIYYYVWSVPQTGMGWYTIITRIRLPPPKAPTTRSYPLVEREGHHGAVEHYHPIMISKAVEAFCPGTVYRLGPCQFVPPWRWICWASYIFIMHYSRTSTLYSRLRINSGKWTCYRTEYKHLQEYAFTKGMSSGMHPIYSVQIEYYGVRTTSKSVSLTWCPLNAPVI